MSLRKTHQLVSIVWLSIFTVIMASIAVSFIYKIFISKTTNGPKAPFFKYSSIICVGFFFCATIGDLIHITQAYNNNDMSSSTSKYGNAMVFADSSYFMGSLTLYIFIIGKLHLSFRDTLYKVSKKYIALLLILILTLFTMQITYLIAVHEYSAQTFLDVSLKYVTVIIIIDFTIDIGVLLLFIYKLQQILLGSVDIGNFHKYSYSDVPSNSNPSHTVQFVRITVTSHDFNTNQKKLISLITKQSVLGTFIILFNSMFYFKVLIDRYTVSHSFPVDIAFQTSYCLRAVENVVVTFMLYLNFSFSEKIYQRLCICCHNGCYKCCKLFTKRGVSRKTMDAYRSL
eukprot:341678_1